MARAVARRGRGFTRAASSWIWQKVEIAPTGMATTVAIGFEMFVLPANAPDETLFRTLIDLIVYRQGDTAGVVRCSAGLIVSTQRAFAGGIASLPRPLEEAELEWIWRKSFYAGIRTSAAAGANALTQGERVHADIKSRRRLNAEENIVLLLINAGADTLEVAGSVAVLSKISGT